MNGEPLTWADVLALLAWLWSWIMAILNAWQTWAAMGLCVLVGISNTLDAIYRVLVTVNRRTMETHELLKIVSQGISRMDYRQRYDE